MLVKTIVSAAGADFTIEYGQEYEFAELKKLIGNGAENFCTPVDPDAEWPPAAPVETAVVSPDETPEITPVVETTVAPPAPERAAKGRRK